MRMFLILLMIIFTYGDAYSKQIDTKSIQNNKVKHQEELIKLNYIEQYEELKKYYLNKHSLITGKSIQFKSISERQILFLWQEAIDQFIEKNYSESLDKINLILKQDNTNIKNVCLLKITNKLFLNLVDDIDNEFEYCKNISKEENTFSLFYIEALINLKLNRSKEKTDRYFYENAQDFDSEFKIKAFLKLAIVINQHKNIINLLSNLPPSAYESKEIRELLSFIFFRLGENDKVKQYLKNINTINSNNLLGTLFFKDKKWELAHARFLVAYKINPFTESTIDRLIPLTVKTKRLSHALKYLTNKKYFLTSFRNDIDKFEYDLLYIYLNLKNNNDLKAFKKIKSLEQTFKENTPEVILSMAAYLATKTAAPGISDKSYLRQTCREKNIMSCYILQIYSMFGELDYYLSDFAASKASKNLDINKLKSEVIFSPIKERSFINQKYIEELDSL